MSNDDPTQQFPPSAHHEDAPQSTLGDKAVKRRKTNKRILKVLGGLVGAFLIFAIGVAAGGGGPEQVETIKEVEIEVPGETITETVTEEVEVEVPGPERTVEVEVPGEDVEVTPPVCIEAIDQASSMFASTAPIFTNTIPGMLDSLYDGDAATFEGHVNDLDSFSQEFSADADEYNSLKAQCATFPIGDE